jgi:hypothetical protein
VFPPWGLKDYTDRARSPEKSARCTRWTKTTCASRGIAFCGTVASREVGKTAARLLVPVLAAEDRLARIRYRAAVPGATPGLSGDAEALDGSSLWHFVW